MQTKVHDINAKEIVMEFLDALQQKDFESARNYVSDNVSYIGPLNSFDRAEPYFKYVEPEPTQIRYQEGFYGG
jgi:hypothetical protein